MAVYNIIEVANTHYGDKKYIYALLKEFDQFKGAYGIKFQPFKYDKIALPDFFAYERYKLYYYDKKEWQEIIKRAKKTKDVWLDIFDEYSVTILKENLKNIKGIKFQASVLHNKSLHVQLKEVDLSSTILVVNIAAHNIDEIATIVSLYEKELKPKEIVLQIGFQAYPTKLQDSGLSKIQEIKKHFKNKISFTEHLDPNTEESLQLPVIAGLMGATIIEKHVMHSSLETKADFQSSVTASQYVQYIKLQKKYQQLSRQPFINEREQEYLNKTLQIPVLKVDKKAGQLLDVNSELDFKRSNSGGLNIKEVEALVESFYIISQDIEKGQTLRKEHFKKANIAAIVACRMKSSRLPKKALLKIGELTSVEYCMRNALRLRNINNVVLATSTLKQDAVLKDYTYSPSVIFHKGHPDDVIDRYLGVAEKLNTNVIVRYTGDSLFISDETLQILLKSHFEKGAEFTRAKNNSAGLNIDIINVEALKRVAAHFGVCEYSEYMTFYFTNNTKHFKVNLVMLPKEIVREYKLSLDYPEDLELVRAIDKHYRENAIEHSIRELYKFLDANPEISNLNKNCIVRYKSDKKLIAEIKKGTTIR